MSKDDVLNMKNGIVIVFGDDNSVQVKKIEEGIVTDVDFQDWLLNELQDARMLNLLQAFTINLLLGSKRIKPPTIGDILLYEFLAPNKLSITDLAKKINVPKRTISTLIKGNSKLTEDLALKLANYFGNSVQFWLNCGEKS